MATGELRQRRQRPGQSISSKKLTEFLDAAEAEETLLLQQRRDREAQQSIGHLTDSLATGIEPPVQPTIPVTVNTNQNELLPDDKEAEPFPLFEDF